MQSITSKSHSSIDFNDDLTMTTCYYVRKLLNKYAHQLQSVLAVGAGLVANAQCNLNHVLESLYLEELEIQLMARELEVLVEIHQTLSATKDSESGVSKQLSEVERRIFWILGFKVIAADEGP